MKRFRGSCEAFLAFDEVGLCFCHKDFFNFLKPRDKSSTFRKFVKYLVHNFFICLFCTFFDKRDLNDGLFSQGFRILNQGSILLASKFCDFRLQISSE
jgi:hypothetical protein